MSLRRHSQQPGDRLQQATPLHTTQLSCNKGQRRGGYEVRPGVQGTESPAGGNRGESPGTPRGRVGGTKHNPSWAPKEKGPGRALVHPAGWVGRAHPILGAVGAATGQGPYNDVRLITGGVQRGLAPLVGVWGYPPHTEGGWVGPNTILLERPKERVQGAPCQGAPCCKGSACWDFLQGGQHRGGIHASGKKGKGADQLSAPLPW